MMMSLIAFSQAPVIGIAATPTENRHTAHGDYVTAVTRAGGIPMIIPATTDSDLLASVLDRVDGVLLAGGVDVDPGFYGEEHHPMLGEVNALRDTFEIELIHQAVARHKPVFGVCRGLQMLNVALGGTLWQDIPSQVPEAGAHRVTGDSSTIIAHTVSLDPGSVSARVLGATEFEVNSRHHQSVHEVAPTLKVSGHSPDGIVEMIEGYPDRPILGVQWHPENFVAANGNPLMLRFFKFLVDESVRCRK